MNRDAIIELVIGNLVIAIAKDAEGASMSAQAHVDEALEAVKLLGIDPDDNLILSPEAAAVRRKLRGCSEDRCTE